MPDWVAILLSFPFYSSLLPLGRFGVLAVGPNPRYRVAASYENDFTREYASKATGRRCGAVRASRSLWIYLAVSRSLSILGN